MDKVRQSLGKVEGQGLEPLPGLSVKHEVASGIWDIGHASSHILQDCPAL